jgi:hypothetical protein
MPDKLPQTIVWKASSHTQHKRTYAWYLGFGIISLGLILFALFTHSILTLITFILLIVVVFIFATQPAVKVSYKLTNVGIEAGSITYPYKIIKKFWITYNPPTIKTLSFETSAYLNNKVSLQLGDQDPVMVKSFLNQYLPEDLDRQDSLSETLARGLKI